MTKYLRFNVDYIENGGYDQIIKIDNIRNLQIAGSYAGGDEGTRNIIRVFLNEGKDYINIKYNSDLECENILGYLLQILDTFRISDYEYVCKNKVDGFTSEGHILIEGGNQFKIDDGYFKTIMESIDNNIYTL